MNNYIAGMPVPDKMLYSLYNKRDKQGYVRLSETIGCECDWRIIAEKKKKKDYIEYPGGATYSSLGRITQKGINYIEKKYG